MSEQPYATIRCEFKFKCPRSWGLLAETAEPSIRYCGTCKRSVHLVTSDEELAAQAAQGHCVAVPVREHPRRAGEAVPLKVGEPLAPYGE